MAIFFDGQCRLADTLLAKPLGVKFSQKWHESHEDKIKRQELVSAGHVILKFLPLIGYNLLLIYYRFEYEDNFYKYGLYYAWVQMLLQMGPLLHLGPVITLVPSTSSLRSCGNRCYSSQAGSDP